MKKIVPQISFSVFLLSALIYGVGRWVVRNPISDDAGDWFLWSGGIAAAVLLFTLLSGAPFNVRKSINAGTASLVVFLTAFGTWGVFSGAGQNQFPEMAGLFPFYALLLAGLFLVLLVIMNLLWKNSLSKQKRAHF